MLYVEPEPSVPTTDTELTTYDVIIRCGGADVVGLTSGAAARADQELRVALTAHSRAPALPNPTDAYAPR